MGLDCLFLLPAPTLTVPSSLVSVISVSLSLGVWWFPLPPRVCYPERKTRRWPAHCFLTHTLSHSFSSLQTQLWSSSATESSRKNLPLLPPLAASPTLFSLHHPGTPSSCQALLPCQTQMSPGALMSLPCGSPVPGVPESLRRATTAPFPTLAPS